MKPAFKRTLLFILIIAVSFGFGKLFDSVCTKIERTTYPRSFSEIIDLQAIQNDIPPEMVYALIRTESRFESNFAGERGQVGLLQMTPATFEWVARELLQEDLLSGLLYEPETNIRAGTAYLSYLWKKYGHWETVLCAWYAGTDTVDTWLSDSELTDDNHVLTSIPDHSVQKFVKKVTHCREVYERLYR